MWWLRSVGSIQLQVSFAKEPYERDYNLLLLPQPFGQDAAQSAGYWKGFGVFGHTQIIWVTVSTETASSTQSRHSESLASCGTNSN